MNDTITALQSCEILGGLDRPVIEILARVAERRQYALGEALFVSGDERLDFWLIVSGQVEVRVESGDAAGTVVIFGPGDALGEAGLLEPGIHSATARAVSAVKVLQLSVDSVRHEL